MRVRNEERRAPSWALSQLQFTQRFWHGFLIFTKWSPQRDGGRANSAKEVTGRVSTLFGLSHLDGSLEFIVFGGMSGGRAIAKFPGDCSPKLPRE
jgi:hypothetical protein